MHYGVVFTTFSNDVHVIMGNGSVSYTNLHFSTMWDDAFFNYISAFCLQM